MNKLHMGMKRMLTGMLAAAMIVTSIPAYAFAEEIQAGDDTAVVSEAGTDDAAVFEENSEESVIQAEEEETVTESQEETVSDEEGSVSEEELNPETEETEAIAEDKAPEAELLGEPAELEFFFADESIQHYFYYTVNDGKVTLTEVKGTVAGSMEMPESINGMPVTVLGDGLFENDSAEAYTGPVTIPAGVVTIGKDAFSYCDGINGTLTIPDNVTTIGDGAFNGCSITELIIGSNVTTIGENALNCSSLVKVVNNSTTEFTLPECEGKKWVDKDGNTITKIKNGTATLFDDNFEYEEKANGAIIITGYKGTAAGTLVIPAKINGKTVTEIGDEAFKNCSGFTGLDMGSNITSIGKEAFSGCTGLTGSLMIGENVTVIGDSAFFGCTGLTGSLIIPDKVTKIGEKAFYNCRNFNGTLTIGNKVETIGDSAFSGDYVDELTEYNSCRFTGNLTIPDSVTKIGDYAFCGCSGFNGRLTIGNKVETIGNNAFFGKSMTNSCHFTGNLTIPDSVMTIGDYAFQNCTRFNGTLTIGNNVTSIGQFAFQKCEFTGDLIIPVSAATIGRYAFNGCEHFDGNLVLLAKTNKIETAAFQGCKGFIGLFIPETVREIKTWAFDAFTSLKMVQNLSEVEFTLPEVSGKTWKNEETGETIDKIAKGTAVRSDVQEPIEKPIFTYLSVDPQTYTGKQIKPQITVFFGKNELTQKTDYTISFKNNTNVGTATFTITAKGNYSGKETGTFAIVAKNIEDEDVTVSELASAAYNSKKDYKPVPVIKYNGKKLADKKDFTVAYYTDNECETEPVVPRASGTYYAKVTGTKNYTGSRILSFVIADADKIPVSKLSVAKIPNQNYTGEQISPPLVIRNGRTELKETDYILKYGQNIDVGTGTVVIIGQGSYAGVRTVTFNIIGRPMNKVKITGIPSDPEVYNGSAKKFVFDLVYKENKNAGEEPVIWKTQDDYDGLSDVEKQKVGCIVTLDDDANAGKKTITFKGINGYSGTVKKTYKINPYVISNETIDLFKITLDSYSIPYAKGGAKPKPTVKFGEDVLKEGRDYTVSYANNTALNNGTGKKLPTVKVTGKGNFKGTDSSTTFNIIKADMAAAGVQIIAKDVVFQNKAGKWTTKFTVAGPDGKALKAGTDYDKNVVYSYDEEGESIIGSKAIVGADTTIYVTVKAKEGSPYTGYAVGSYRVVKSDIGKLKVTVDPKTFTGKEIKLTPADITWKSGNKKIEDVTFTIDETSYKNNDKKGKATVVVRGTGNYGGTKTITYTIGAKGLKWWWNLMN